MQSSKRREDIVDRECRQKEREREIVKLRSGEELQLIWFSFNRRKTES